MREKECKRAGKAVRDRAGTRQRENDFLNCEMGKIGDDQSRYDYLNQRPGWSREKGGWAGD